jgi:hypothetical protein
MAGFGVLSGLSLFSALWPVSAIVTAVVVAGHATGIDVAAWSLARKLATNVAHEVRGNRPGAPASPPAPPAPPAAPAPAPPVPSAPSAPKRDVHPPSTAAHVRRAPRVRKPEQHSPVRARHHRGAEHRVETGVDGPGI